MKLFRELRLSFFFALKMAKKNREFLLCNSHGWGTWIRTKEMSDSESDALPLGYTPMRLFIIHYWLFFYKCFFI